MTAVLDGRPGVIFELPPGTRVVLTGRSPHFRRGAFLGLVEEAQRLGLAASVRRGTGAESLELANGVRLDVMPWRLDCWHGQPYDLIITPGPLDEEHEAHARVVTATSRLGRAS